MFELLNTSEKRRQFFSSYGAFLVNGMLALSIGSLLPFIKEAKGLDYAFSGLIVSLHSIGNLASGFLAGILAVYLGRKKSILIFESLFSISFLLLIFGGSRFLLALAFLLTGLARGASSNFNNTSINNLAPGKAWAINGLHAMFAVGAFSFPLLLTLATSFDREYWRYICFFMAGMGVLTH
ncbi:MAG: MFS transporter, partial [Lachnospiraceae bacterium]|nr:MFS transporter [Lachnospiraceae bacterium]